MTQKCPLGITTHESNLSPLFLFDFYLVYYLDRRYMDRYVILVACEYGQAPNSRTHYGLNPLSEMGRSGHVLYLMKHSHATWQYDMEYAYPPLHTLSLYSYRRHGFHSCIRKWQPGVAHFFHMYNY